MAAAKKTDPTYEGLRTSLAAAITEMKGLRADRDDAVKSCDAAKATLAAVKEATKALQAEADYERARANALEARIQRMSGYLDRVMDEEDRMERPEAQRQLAPPATKGPAVGSIPMPKRESSRGDNLFTISSTFEGEAYPRRRY